MAAQQTNLCIYRRGHRLRRNTGPYCTALSLDVMSSVKCAAGEDRGISLCLYLSAWCSTLPNQKIFTVEQNIRGQHTELRGSTLYPSRTMFVCSRRKTSVSSGLRCELPAPVSGVVRCRSGDLRSRQEVLRDCLSPEVEGGIPRDGAAMSGRFCATTRAEKSTSPESAIWPHRLHCWAQINKAENSAQK